MKQLHLWLLILPLLVACRKEVLSPETPGTAGAVYHGMIELGGRMEDPYAVRNITRALQSLYPTRAERVDITPTDLYVRILPTKDQYEELVAMGLQLFDHPLDYQIVREGDYYHDPEVGKDLITWQYTVVPAGFSLPEGIRCELIDQCYIAEHAGPTRGGDGIDWEAVERESYRLTGHADLLVPAVRGESFHPSGRITIEDPDANGGKPFGVAGVRVSCNTFVKFSSAWTDRDGYYEIPASFSTEPRYRLVFKNEKGFGIGINLILVPASVSTLGKNGPEGVDLNVTSASDGALFRRCVVNNAAYEYYERCKEEDMDIKAPPKDLRFWIFPHLSSSSTCMLHHGAFLENKLLTEYLGNYTGILRHFVPDITIGTKDAVEYADLYQAVTHEMSHASHYAQVGNAYWDRYIAYIIASFVLSGGESYGTGSDKDAGCCEVGEMWAYFNQAKMFRERYGGVTPTFGSSFWFRPQILRYLDERGLGREQIFRALTSEVDSRDKLRDKLNSLYPGYQSVIDQVFDRYSDN